jgi:hypothetical protein
MLGKIGDFVIDYIDRHKHPVNAVLHIVGVPMAFFGLFQLIADDRMQGLGLLVGGYFLQYLGHRAQGNEVGEVTLLKAIWRKLFGAKSLSQEDC